MTDERTRTELHGKLEEVLGPVHSDALMAHLPPSGSEGVATKEDLERLRADFEGFQRVMRAEMRSFQHEMRGEMRSFQHDIRAELGSLRHELAAVEERMRAHTADAVARTTRTMVLTVVFALVGTMLTTASMFLALA